MDPSFAQGIHDLLNQTLTNQDVKGATAKLNVEYYKSPACISALASIYANSTDAGMRQLSAVEMRKRISHDAGKLWMDLTDDERHQIKERYPDLVMNDESNPVRQSGARVIAAIASIELPLGTWNDILPKLQQACVSPNVKQRETAMFIMYTVLESSIDSATVPQMIQLFQTTINDPESIEVRISTVRCLGSIAQWIDSDEKTLVAAYQTMIPSMIQVIGQCVETSNDVGARHLFEVLETLLILEIPVLSKGIPDLVQFLLQCGGNKAYDTDLRILALNALSWTIQYKKSKLQSLGLGPVILMNLMPITTEEEPEDIDEDAPSRSALRIIDTLSTNLPPSQVFPALRELIVEYFSSPEPSRRRGAVLALGIAVEGCSEFMTPRMAEVWPVVEAALQDSDPSVRKSGCIAVSCLCEWLEDECSAKHAVLIPAIMNIINDPATQKSACTALDALLEILHEVIGQYLQLIMERLIVLLESAPLNIKGVVTGAIGSAAHASGKAFVPYFQPTMERLQHFLLLTGEGEEIELRGVTMDAIGTFAEAVGSELFRPYFHDMMKQAFQGLEMGSARLRECSFLFFGVMARVFGEEFAPFLPNVVPPLLTSLQQSEGPDDFNVSEATNAFNSGSSPSNAIAINDTDDNGNPSVELEDIDLDKLLDVNSAIAVEKEIAADTIGALFAATGRHFIPFVEPCVLELIQALQHYYEGLRKSALDSLLEIVRAFYDLSNPPDWESGQVVTLDRNVIDLINHVLTPLLDMYDGEDNKTVVSALCMGLAETINKVGPVFFQDKLDNICQIAIQVLEQKAYCQQDPDQDDDDEAPEDQAEYDSVLISSAGDLVASLANALGSGFSPYFSGFFPLIAKFYSKNRSLSERSSSIGCLAEIIAGLKSAVTPYTQSLSELFYTALQDSEAEVLSNAAFAVGLLIEHSEVDLAPQYLPLLGALRPLFSYPADAPSARLNAKDNAAGAVGRMIVRGSPSLPMDQVLPIFFAALPLKNDRLENRPVFRAIFYLFNNKSQSLLPFMDHLLEVFAFVLDPNSENIGDDIRAELVQLVTVLNAEMPERIQVAGLSAFVGA